MGDKWVFTIGIAGGADIADTTITAMGGAVFTAIKNYLQMQCIPFFSREELF
jgi:hypothetical protein